MNGWEEASGPIEGGPFGPISERQSLKEDWRLVRETGLTAY